jgi:hypothetical protein
VSSAAKRMEVRSESGGNPDLLLSNPAAQLSKEHIIKSDVVRHIRP